MKIPKRYLKKPEPQKSPPPPPPPTPKVQVKKVEVEKVVPVGITKEEVTEIVQSATVDIRNRLRKSLASYRMEVRRDAEGLITHIDVEAR